MSKANKVAQFLNLIEKEAHNFGAEVLYHSKRFIKVSPNMHVSGFWDGDAKQINVAVYCDEWLTILAHEFGHLCQQREKKFIDTATTNAYIYFDEWLLGERELSKKRLDDVCELIQICELDCEKRALKLIKKFNLYSSDSLYIQKANSYVLGYEAAKVSRKWFKRSPSGQKEVYSIMSKKFTRTLTPNKKRLQALLVSCF